MKTPFYIIIRNAQNHWTGLTIDKNSISIIMDILFDNPIKEYHAREFSRALGFSIFSVLEAIKVLSKSMITVHKKGNMKIIKASHSVAFIRAKRVRNIEKLYDSGLVDYLSDAYETPEAVIVFGSYSRGDDVEKSDIDIAVINIIKIHKKEVPIEDL